MLASATVAVAGLMFCALFEAANSRIYLRMSEKGAGALPATSEQRSLVRNLRALKRWTQFEPSVRLIANA